MTDDAYRNMVISHDKNIDVLANSVKTLASNVAATNSRLEDVIEVMTTQNVLIEKVNNIDKNTAESFKRAWHSIGALEETVNKKGCNAVREAAKEQDRLHAKITSVEAEIDIIKDAHTTIDKNLSKYVSGATVKWFLGIVIFYSAAFGVYTVNSIHNTEKELSSYIAKNEEDTKYITTRVSEIYKIIMPSYKHK